MSEDIPNLILDLPNMLLAKIEHKKQKTEVLKFRVSPEEKFQIEKNAEEKGFNGISGYLRNLALTPH